MWHYYAHLRWVQQITVWHELGKIKTCCSWNGWFDPKCVIHSTYLSFPGTWSTMLVIRAVRFCAPTKLQKEILHFGSSITWKFKIFQYISIRSKHAVWHAKASSTTTHGEWINTVVAASWRNSRKCMGICCRTIPVTMLFHTFHHLGCSLVPCICIYK